MNPQDMSNRRAVPRIGVALAAVLAFAACSDAIGPEPISDRVEVELVKLQDGAVVEGIAYQIDVAGDEVLGLEQRALTDQEQEQLAPRPVLQGQSQLLLDGAASPLAPTLQRTTQRYEEDGAEVEVIALHNGGAINAFVVTRDGVLNSVVAVDRRDNQLTNVRTALYDSNGQLEVMLKARMTERGRGASALDRLETVWAKACELLGPQALHAQLGGCINEYRALRTARLGLSAATLALSACSTGPMSCIVAGALFATALNNYYDRDALYKQCIDGNPDPFRRLSRDSILEPSPASNNCILLIFEETTDGGRTWEKVGHQMICFN